MGTLPPHPFLEAQVHSSTHFKFPKCTEPVFPVFFQINGHLQEKAVQGIAKAMVQCGRASPGHSHWEILQESPFGSIRLPDFNACTSTSLSSPCTQHNKETTDACHCHPSVPAPTWAASRSPNVLSPQVIQHLCPHGTPMPMVPRVVPAAFPWAEDRCCSGQPVPCHTQGETSPVPLHL